MIHNFLHSIGDWLYYAVLRYHLRNMRSVLDVGCGSNSPLAKVRKSIYSVGIDAYAPAIRESQKYNIHTAYKRGNVIALDRYFPKKSFDAVIALDLIEHLEKKDGKVLIEKMTRLARKIVIIMTPQGFVPQKATQGNEFQIHKSGWSIADFTGQGFTVYGIRGPRWIRGEYATIKYRPWIIWGLISTIAEPFLYFFPRFAYQLFAVKIIRK